jgi:hypothetical protein
VSRVGSAAQFKSMKQVAGKIKLELAQYREMAAFSQFASDLDKATQNLLARGERLTELLKQPQYSPYLMEEQVVVLFAGVRGYLNKVPVADIQRFEKDMLRTLQSDAPHILEMIRDEKMITEAVEKELRVFLDHFYQRFCMSFLMWLLPSFIIIVRSEQAPYLVILGLDMLFFQRKTIACLDPSIYSLKARDPRIKKSHCFSREKQDFSSPRMTRRWDIATKHEEYRA